MTRSDWQRHALAAGLMAGGVAVVLRGRTMIAAVRAEAHARGALDPMAGAGAGQWTIVIGAAIVFAGLFVALRVADATAVRRSPTAHVVQAIRIVTTAMVFALSFQLGAVLFATPFLEADPRQQQIPDWFVRASDAVGPLETLAALGLVIGTSLVFLAWLVAALWWYMPFFRPKDHVARFLLALPAEQVDGAAADLSAAGFDVAPATSVDPQRRLLTAVRAVAGSRREFARWQSAAEAVARRHGGQVEPWATVRDEPRDA